MTDAEREELLDKLEMPYFPAARAHKLRLLSSHDAAVRAEERERCASAIPHDEPLICTVESYLRLNGVRKPAQVSDCRLAILRAIERVVRAAPEAGEKEEKRG